MTVGFCSVRLSAREIDLLLRHACPFGHEQKQLLAFQQRGGSHVLKIDPFYLSPLIGDLVHAAKSIRDPHVLDELDGLCVVLENAERRDSAAGRHLAE